MVYIGFRVHIGFKVARSRCVHVFCEGLLRLSPSIASETFNLEDFGFGTVAGLRFVIFKLNQSLFGFRGRLSQPTLFFLPAHHGHSELEDV